jgi:ElaB/YqjD/DUF883 family membrane-anchored ribosome-binding protein
MSERAEGAVADTGEVIQRQINQAGDVAHQVTDFIRDYPIAAVLMAAGVGYLLNKII